MIEGIEEDLGIGSGAEVPEEPSGRVLADLYFFQGHFGEAFALYRELAASNLGDGELARLRGEAAARLAAEGPVSLASPARAALRGARGPGFETLVERDTRPLTPVSPRRTME